MVHRSPGRALVWRGRRSGHRRQGPILDDAVGDHGAGAREGGNDPHADTHFVDWPSCCVASHRYRTLPSYAHVGARVRRSALSR